MSAPTSSHADRGTWPAVGIALALGVGVAVQVRHQLQPLERQLRHVADDAFYYLGVARHLAHGEGFTLDGVTVTSGFHPLWMLVVTGLAPLGRGDPALLYRAALVAACAAHLGAVALLGRFLARHSPPAVAAALTLAFGVSPGVLDNTVLGCEGALVALALTAVLFRAEAPWEARAAAVGEGLLLGVAFLARTDTAFFALGWMGGRAALARRRGATWSATARATLAVGLGAAAPVLGWWLVAWLEFGTVVQQSQAIKRFWHARDVLGLAPGEQALHAARQLAHWGWDALRLHWPAALPALGLVAVAWLRRRSVGGARPAAPATGLASPAVTPQSGGQVVPAALLVTLVALLTQVALAGLYYAVAFPGTRRWYFVAASLLWPVLGAVAASAAGVTGGRRWPLAALALAALTLVGAHGLVRRDYSTTDGLSTLAQRLHTLVPAGAVVGAYSAGKMAYFARVPVVNLDGLANNDILPVARERAMTGYLERRGIGYIADFTVVRRSLERDGGPPASAPLIEIARQPVVGGDLGDVVLYALPGRGRPQMPLDGPPLDVPPALPETGRP